MKLCRTKVPLLKTKVLSIPKKLNLTIVGMVMALNDIESLLTLATFYKVIEVAMEN